MFLKISVHLLIIMLEQQFSVPFFFQKSIIFTPYRSPPTQPTIPPVS